MQTDQSHHHRRALYLLLEERQRAEAKTIEAINKAARTSKEELLETLAGWLWTFGGETPADPADRAAAEASSEVSLTRWESLRRELDGVEATIEELSPDGAIERMKQLAGRFSRREPSPEEKQTAEQLATANERRKVIAAELEQLCADFVRDAMAHQEQVLASPTIGQTAQGVLSRLETAIATAWRDHATAEREALAQAREHLAALEALYPAPAEEPS